jgi:hypothetical protein
MSQENVELVRSLQDQKGLRGSTFATKGIEAIACRRFHQMSQHRSRDCLRIRKLRRCDSLGPWIGRSVVSRNARRT